MRRYTDLMDHVRNILLQISLMYHPWLLFLRLLLRYNIFSVSWYCDHDLEFPVCIDQITQDTIYLIGILNRSKI